MRSIQSSTDEIDGIPVYRRSIVACDIDYTDATIQQAVAYVETCLNSSAYAMGCAYRASNDRKWAIL